MPGGDSLKPAFDFPVGLAMVVADMSARNAYFGFFWFSGYFYPPRKSVF